MHEVIISQYITYSVTENKLIKMVNIIVNTNVMP